MRLVIADTGPINYLVQIGHVELLPQIFERVAIPRMVQTELSNPHASASVLSWIQTAPNWLEIHEVDGLPKVKGLDEGETAAIALAISLRAELLLIDEREGCREAERQGLCVTGTLGVLDLAAERGLVDFASAISALEKTSFRRPAALLKVLLSKHGPPGGV